MNLDRKKTFVIEHMGFFARWYDFRASSSEKTSVQSFIESGRIEILNRAAVAAHDEAATYYQDIFDNFRIGASWYHKTLDKEEA